MLKKIVSLVVTLCATGVAQADQGPVYVSYPGYCNIKQIYMDNSGGLYGREVGCTGILGQPMMGFVQPNGSFVFAGSDGGGNACLHTYNANGNLYVSCSSGFTTNYHVPFPYVVSFSRPYEVTPKGGKSTQLPQLPF